MAAKAFLVICAQTLLIQAAFCQYIPGNSIVSGNSVVDNTISIGNSFGAGISGSGVSGGSGFSSGSGFGSVLSGSSLSGINGVASGSGLAGNGLSAGLINGQTGLNVVSGGPLLVTSISPIGPSGLAVASENGIEGVLTVTGQLPFLSAVAFEGGLPTAGSGVASCGCGNGEVGIVSEGLPNSQAANNAVRGGRRF
ncbi:hypothetical protein ABMA27_010911 [Loxostege sticticalis]|uniref:Uncharacterized protein n=1 Tax=Loxostege sticticalis TaxID=481309 RepID=A0ABR3H310_LOXSC